MFIDKRKMVINEKKTKSSNNRDYRYDYIRVLSMISIITIHVSQYWMNNLGKLEGSINEYVTCFLNTISRFGVPCFIMLSGAFLLENDKNMNYKYFYVKEMRKQGIPTLLFSLLYIVYRAICIIIMHDGKGNELLKDIIIGKPMYHMWYMYMLIGLYALTPICIRFKNSISKKQFQYVAILFLLLSVISVKTRAGNVGVYWDIGLSYSYMGYFMMGYVVKNDETKRTPNGLFFIVLGLLVGVITSLTKCRLMLNGMSEEELKLFAANAFSPYALSMSLSFFTGFSYLNLKYNCIVNALAKKSLYIFLLHVGVWDIIRKSIKYLKGDLISWDCCFWIPTFVIIVLLISTFLSIYTEILVDKIIVKLSKKSLPFR